jgi:hypothetical protein
MTLGELEKELKQEVTQEMLRKHIAEMNDSAQSEPASRDRLYNESVDPNKIVPNTKSRMRS